MRIVTTAAIYMYIIFKCLQAGLADIFRVVEDLYFYFSKPCGCCGELCTFVKISISKPCGCCACVCMHFYCVYYMYFYKP